MGRLDGLSREARLLIEGRDGEKERQKDTLRETERERVCVCVTEKHGTAVEGEAKRKLKLRKLLPFVELLSSSSFSFPFSTR